MALTERCVASSRDRGFDESEDLTDEEGAQIETVLREIRHTEGRLGCMFWDDWTPREWLEAARKARLPIPVELANALSVDTHEPDADRLQKENAELMARIAMLESELLEPSPKRRNTLLRVIAALMNLPKIIPESEYTTIHGDINTALEMLGAKRIRSDTTIGDVIKEARALVKKDQDETGSEIGLD